jgi:dolichol-phosphate mannosyltransferase
MIKVFGINNIPSGGFDLILFDKEIQNEVLKISEKNTNIVYLISWLGYPYVSIPYVRQKREHGTSQWFFWKKVRLLVDSVFSFTMLPAYWIRLTFVFMLVADFIFVIYEVCVRSIHPFNMMIMFFLTLILANILIISEYLLRIHDSVRNRPSFVVDKVLKFEN